MALKKAQSDERIEEVAGRARMQAKAAGQRGKVFGAFGELGKDFHFDCAEQSLGGPEGDSGLQNVIWSECGRSHSVPFWRWGQRVFCGSDPRCASIAGEVNLAAERAMSLHDEGAG